MLTRATQNWFVALLAAGCTTSGDYEPSTEDLQRFVTERCASVNDCCSAATQEECELAESRTLAGLQAQDTGALAYSEACYAQMLEQAESAECGEVEACRLAHGAGRHGDVCTMTSSMFYTVDTCAADLQCRAGRCVDDPFLAPKTGRSGDSCSPYELCDDGFFCGDDERCAATKPLGEACTQPRECEGGNLTFCEVAQGDETGLCAPGRPRGETCETGFECEVECDDEGACSKLSCHDGRCGSEPPSVCIWVE